MASENHPPISKSENKPETPIKQREFTPGPDDTLPEDETLENEPAVTTWVQVQENDIAYKHEKLLNIDNFLKLPIHRRVTHHKKSLNSPKNNPTILRFKKSTVDFKKLLFDAGANLVIVHFTRNAAINSLNKWTQTALNKLAGCYEDVTCVEINADSIDSEEICVSYSVFCFPTFLIFKNTAKIASFQAKTESQLYQIFRQRYLL